jgi:DNA polymerase-1
MRAELVGVSLAIGAGEACYIPLRHRPVADDMLGEAIEQLSVPDVLKALKPLLEDENITKVAHNLKYDLIIMLNEYEALGELEEQEGGQLAGPLPQSSGSVGQRRRRDIPRLVGRKGFFPLALRSFEDTMLMSACLDAGKHAHGLDLLAIRHFGHAMIKFADVAGRGQKQVTFDRVPLAAATPYAGEDADVTWRLYEVLKPRLEK